MAFDDVEKRLNSSLDALIASSKKVGAGRGGRGGASGRGGKAGRGRGNGRASGPGRDSQGKAADRDQAGSGKKKGLKVARGGVQKQGAGKGTVMAVPVKTTARRGVGGGRRGGAGGRGGGDRQQPQQALHPAALKITIRNDKFTGEAPSATWNNDQGSDPYTVGGFGPRSGYYGQAAGQAAGPLTFGGASAATSMAAPRQQRPVWAAAGGYYNGTQHDDRTGASGAVRRPVATQWPAQTGYGSGSLRMDQETQRY